MIRTASSAILGSSVVRLACLCDGHRKDPRSWQFCFLVAILGRYTTTGKAHKPLRPPCRHSSRCHTPANRPRKEGTVQQGGGSRTRYSGRRIVNVILSHLLFLCPYYGQLHFITKQLKHAAKWTTFSGCRFEVSRFGLVPWKAPSLDQF